MAKEEGTATAFSEQIRIQAQVLIPVIKAFQIEFGKARVHRIVEKVLGKMQRLNIEQTS